MFPYVSGNDSAFIPHLWPESRAKGGSKLSFWASTCRTARPIARHSVLCFVTSLQKCQWARCPLPFLIFSYKMKNVLRVSQPREFDESIRLDSLKETRSQKIALRALSTCQGTKKRSMAPGTKLPLRPRGYSRTLGRGVHSPQTVTRYTAITHATFAV